MNKQISFSDEERTTLQTLIAAKIRQNKKIKEYGFEPHLKTKDLKDLYRKIADYNYEER